MIYIIEVYVSFIYGWRIISFKRTFEVPFVPFYNMGLIINDEKRYVVYFHNNKDCSTTINWNINNEQFEVDVQNTWRGVQSKGTINEILKKYSSWTRTDDTNVKTLIKFFEEI